MSKKIFVIVIVIVIVVLTYILKPKYECVWTLAKNAEAAELFKAFII